MASGLANGICCPMSWREYGGHCYRYFTYEKTFNDARIHCLSLDADLVSIHSASENNIVNELSSGEEVGHVLNNAHVIGGIV